MLAVFIAAVVPWRVGPPVLDAETRHSQGLRRHAESLLAIPHPRRELLTPICQRHKLRLRPGGNMKKFKLVVAAIIAATAAACATAKELVPVGGSRADGTVQLAFDYGGFEKPVVDGAAALVTATQRCQAWGYKNAEAFGGAQQQCTASNQYGCMAYRVTVSYQCTGANSPN